MTINNQPIGALMRREGVYSSSLESH